MRNVKTVDDLVIGFNPPPWLCVITVIRDIIFIIYIQLRRRLSRTDRADDRFDVTPMQNACKKKAHIV